MRKWRAAGNCSRATLFLHLLLIELALLLSAGGSGRSAHAAEPRQVKVGVITSLSGPLVTIGTALKNGIELARSDKPEGISGLQFIYEDDQSSTTSAVSAFKKLTTVDGIDLIFIFGSHNGNAVGQFAEKRKVPVFTFAFEPDFAVGNKFIIRPFPPSEKYVQVLLERLREDGLKRFMIVESEFSFIDSMVAAFRRNIRPGEHFEVLHSFNPGESDFRAVLTRLKVNPPAMVGVFLLPDQIVPFYRQSREQQLEFIGYGTDFYESALELTNGSPILDGSLYPDNNPSHSFRERYRKRYGNEDQMTFAASAYDMTVITAKLLAPLADPDGDQIIARFQTQPLGTGVLGPYSFIASETDGQYLATPLVVKTIKGQRGVADEKGLGDREDLP